MPNVPIAPKWVDDLPVSPHGIRPLVLADLYAILVDHPGRWAIVETSSTSVAAANKAMHRKNVAKKPRNAGHRWEFASRGCDVYARYLGPADQLG